MRPRLTLALTLVLAVTASTHPRETRAQETRAHWLVDVDWLAAHIDDPDLVLLHVGQEEEYATEHIPGARYITLSEISAPEHHDTGEGLSLQMPAPETLAAALEGLGISDDSRIVVYYGSDWVTPSARVLLTLDWIGLGAHASLLDGGMQRWKAAGGQVTDVVPSPGQGSVTPRVRSGLIVTADWVNAHRGDPEYAIVDARAPVHYDGIQPTYLHRQPVRKGHIPGAVNVPFNQLWNDDLTLKSASELRAIFEAAGVHPGQTVVGYCHLGQFATAMLLGARTLGYDVKLYDGSFQEWGSRDDLPVEGPDGDAGASPGAGPRGR